MGWSSSIGPIKPKTHKPKIDYRDIADRIRGALTAEDVARRYNYEPNSAGFIRCPFHQGDHTASLKLYPGDKGWYCFGCGEHGDVIGLVMKLYDLDFKQAVKKLDDDFSLRLLTNTADTATTPAPPRKPDNFREKKRLEDQYYDYMNLKVHYMDIVKSGEKYLDDPENAPEWWLNAADAVEYLAVKMLELEEKIDALTNGGG